MSLNESNQVKGKNSALAEFGIWLQPLHPGLYNFGLDLRLTEFPKSLVFSMPEDWGKMNFHS